MTVEFLPIANNPGANVVSQADYEDLLDTGGALEDGFVAGLAKSAEVNKPLRQATVMAAAIANFIASITSGDVLDDGDVDALSELFGTALRAGAASKGADSGAANAYVVTLVPAISAYYDGLPVSFIAANANTGAATLNAGGGVIAIKGMAGNALKAGDIRAGDIVTVLYNSAASFFYMASITRSEIFTTGAAVTSAATADLFASGGNSMTVTGSTGPITSFGTAPIGFLAFVTFASTPTLTYNATSMILPGAANIVMEAGTTGVFLSLGSGNWKCLALQLSSGVVSRNSLQDQTYVAFTTGGTSTAFTGTPSPATASLATNQLYFVTFNAAAGATPTLAISGLTAKNLKYTNSEGTKLPVTLIQIPSGWSGRVFYDGTDYVLLDIPRTAVQLSTAQASTSGTSIDFSIPAGAKGFKVSFVGVSTNGGSDFLFQLGDAGGVEVSGYLGAGSLLQSSGPGSANTYNYTTGIGSPNSGAGALRNGSITFSLVNAATFTYAAEGTIGESNASGIAISVGSKATSALATTLRCTTVNGTDAFDAGLIGFQAFF